MTSTNDLFRADLRRLAELFEEKPSMSVSRETMSISPAEPSSRAKISPAVLKGKQPSLRRRAARSIIIFSYFASLLSG